MPRAVTVLAKAKRKTPVTTMTSQQADRLHDMACEVCDHVRYKERKQATKVLRDMLGLILQHMPTDN